MSQTRIARSKGKALGTRLDPESSPVTSRPPRLPWLVVKYFNYLILVTGLLSWFNPDKSPSTPLLFVVFSYVWSGFIVLFGISLNVYSKNEAKINAWIIKHGAKYSTYLSNRRQKGTTLMENVWCPIFIMASVSFIRHRVHLSSCHHYYGHVSKRRASQERTKS